MSGDVAHDIPAEQAVLGAMMLSPDALADCLEILTPGAASFYRPAHQMIYEAIRSLADEAEPVDVLTVKAELERRSEISKTGKAGYLHTLLAAPPAAANGPWYARKLLELHMTRSLAEAAARIGQIATTPEEDRAGKADLAQAALDEATGVASSRRSVSVADLIGPALDALQAGPDTTRGILTGWRDLDHLIPGFRPGEVVIVGGRPGMGKSVVLLNVATYAALTMRVPVLACSLEMTCGEYMDRLLSSVSGVEFERIRDRVLSERDWELIGKVHGQLADADTLRINDDTSMTIADIRAELRAMRRAGQPAQLLTVDYLQLMTGNGKPENRQMEVSAISRSLKRLAGEFGIPVLVGSQLNRGPELRSDHRPVLADLRESGSLEQDCSIAILLYRADAYEEESVRSGEVDLIVAKNRQGPKATITLAWRGHYAMCADLYKDPA